MITLSLRALSEAERPFVTRLRRSSVELAPDDCVLVEEDEAGALFSGRHGLLEIERLPAEGVFGDVLLVIPESGHAERILRAASVHNTLLVTERCDQLCVMCSQPPKKTHVDRFGYFEQACRLAPRDITIGISGGEPTLYKKELFGLIERVLTDRDDLHFHVLSNGQHFDEDDVERLRNPVFRRVTWGIPLYASDPAVHDAIVAKPGAFERLRQSFHHLLLAGARIELRTVLLQENVAQLRALARYITARLRFIETWSIMQLENIGFARNRWDRLYVDHRSDFTNVAAAIDIMLLRGLPVRLFNFPRCSVPENYRPFAAASISDWKRKFMPGCTGCTEQYLCTGFFEWHPTNHPSAEVTPL